MLRFDFNLLQPSLKRWAAFVIFLGVLGQATTAFAGFKPKPGIGRSNQRIGLASRGGCGVDGASKPLTTIVPLTSGFTATQKPNLSWFMPQHTFPSVEIRLFAQSDFGFEIMHRRVFENLPTNQIVNYDLSAEDVAPLEPNTAYKWQVHLVCNPDIPAGNIFAEGWIQYEAPSVQLTQQIAAAPDLQKADLWLENGYWYEGVQTLWSQMQNDVTRSAAMRSWQALMTDELVKLSHLSVIAPNPPADNALE